jgi:hypothetical protein
MLKKSLKVLAPSLLQLNPPPFKGNPANRLEFFFEAPNPYVSYHIPSEGLGSKHFIKSSKEKRTAILWSH